MQDVRRILVVLNPVHSESLAIRRAKQLALALHAELQLLLCDPRQDYRPFLGRLAEQLEGEGLKASVQQERCDHLHATEAILAARDAHGCDLVVKQHYPTPGLGAALMPPEDWRLLRRCPVPLLLTQTERPWQGGVVLAAMDVDNHEGEHRHLQGNIIAHAIDMAALIHGKVHVVTACQAGFPLAADPCSPRPDGQRARSLEQSQWYQHEYALPDGQLHLLEGSAKAAITRCAHELEAAITIIGTVARRGLAGLLIGNTVEAVLDRVDSDVLVLKPHDHAAHLLAPFEEQARPQGRIEQSR